MAPTASTVAASAYIVKADAHSHESNIASTVRYTSAAVLMPPLVVSDSVGLGRTVWTKKTANLFSQNYKNLLLIVTTAYYAGWANDSTPAAPPPAVSRMARQAH